MCVGESDGASPLERGDPPLVANLVKTEMRLQVGAGKQLWKWFEQSFSGVFILNWSTLPTIYLGVAETV